MGKTRREFAVDQITPDHLPAAVMLASKRSSVFLNKESRRLFSAILKPDNSITFTGNDLRALRDVIARTLKGGKRIEEQIRLTIGGKNVNFDCISNRVELQGRTLAQVLLIKRSRNGQTENDLHLLEKISANSQDVIFHFTFNPKLELKYISDSAKSVLGYTPAEIYKNPGILKNHLQEEDRQLLVLSRKEYLKRSKSNYTKRVLVRFKHKRGTIKHLEIAVNPVYENNNVLTGLIGTMRDSTERIETEALLLETKNKFDLITKNGNDIVAFYTYYPQEKYLYVSPNIKKILGFEERELLQDNSFLSSRLSGPNPHFFGAEDLLKRRQKRNILKNHHFAFKILNKKKEEVWLENNLVPITNNRGKISFYLNILRDVTEQKESDIEIENQYINYRNLLDSSPVAYVIHDHGVCLYVNNALMKLFGLKNKSQILGKFALDFFEEPDRKRAVQRLQEVYSSKSSQNKFHNYTIKDLYGNKVEVEIKSVLIKFNDRDCILSLVNNLSEQREREKEKIKTLITETANKQLQKEIQERQEIERSLIKKNGSSQFNI